MRTSEIKAALESHKLWLESLGGRKADLSGADLSGAKNISELACAVLSIVPDSGSFTGWKKLRGGQIAKLLIPENAKRSNGTERKCRAEFVVVLEGEGVSAYDPTVHYSPGATVKCDKWNADRWVTCGGGIHFFMTRAEAEAYYL